MNPVAVFFLLGYLTECSKGSFVLLAHWTFLILVGWSCTFIQLSWENFLSPGDTTVLKLKCCRKNSELMVLLFTANSQSSEEDPGGSPRAE